MRLANIMWNLDEHEARVVAWREDAWVVLPAVWEGLRICDTDELIHQRVPSDVLDRIIASAHPLPEQGWAWRPAIIHPGKILCIGLNYRRHALESGMALPDHPVVFSKFSNALAAHKEFVPLPNASSQPDYEVELAIVIGRKARHLSTDDALDCVWGYTIADDVSARDLQLKTSQWLLGKSCDKFLPLGPWLVSVDEIPDPNNLEITLKLNGEMRQHSNTRDMIFSCAEIVSYLSTVWTLEPGDVICTGTPEGVILGRPREQQQWLKHGDAVQLTIEGLGEQTTYFMAENPK